MVEHIQPQPPAYDLANFSSEKNRSLALSPPISSLFYLPKMKRSRRETDDDQGLFLSTNESLWKQTEQMRKGEDEVNAYCQTHSIDIDFDDIGFTSWLLEPRRFSTNYCSGKCRFLPVNKVS